MARLNKEEYKSLLQKYGEVYSYSKYQTYLSDPYTYFLNYVLHIPKDKPQNNFNILGDATHTLIENAYEKGWTSEQMLASFYESVIDYQLMDKKFISSSDSVNDSVEAKYVLGYSVKSDKKDEQLFEKEIAEMSETVEVDTCDIT